MDGLFPVDGLEVVPSSAGRWGDWRLGDLYDALRRVVDALGPSAPADRVHVYPPTGLEEHPCVQVTVGDDSAAHRLRLALAEGDYQSHVIEEPCRVAFQARVNEVHLDVQLGSRS